MRFFAVSVLVNISMIYLIFQAQYRLGSCLFACNKYSEALESFSRSLHLLLEDSSSAEKEKLDTLKQILSVAQNNPGILYCKPVILNIKK